MKPLLARLSLIASCAFMVAGACAQPPDKPAGQAATKSARAPAPSPVHVAAKTRAASPVTAGAVSAVGHVIVLADGIVANAVIAQIQSPAPGFVYER